MILVLAALLALGGAGWAFAGGTSTPAGSAKEPVTLAVVGPMRTAEEGYSVARCPDPLVLRQGGYRGAPDSAQQTAASGNGWMAQARPGQSLAAWATCGPMSKR